MINKEEFDMLALLVANRVILGTNGYTFAMVPNVMKPPVYAILVENGVGYLAGDYTPPVEAPVAP